MLIRPNVEVLTEVGTFEVSYLAAEDDFAVSFESFNKDLTKMWVNWLDREDIENLAQACRLLLDMCDRLPKADVA
jgi:hypothetical protein